MAGHIDSATRARLEGGGQWGWFCRRRDELKRDGCPPDDAVTMAAGEALGRCRDSGKAADAGLAVAPEELAGRSASEAETVRWVARNIDNADVGVADCPDPFAWTLLRQCRDNPGFQAFFIEKLWSKLLPNRAQLESEADESELDGQALLDFIGRIEQIGVDCGAGDGDPVRTHTPDIAGSIPAPAIANTTFTDGAS